MKAEVVALGHREFVQAFALGGIRGWEVSSSEEALTCWESILKRGKVALVLIPLWVEKALKEEIVKQKVSPTLPLVLALPDPMAEEMGQVVATIADYIRTSLGVKI